MALSLLRFLPPLHSAVTSRSLCHGTVGFDQLTRGPGSTRFMLEDSWGSFAVDPTGKPPTFSWEAGNRTRRVAGRGCGGVLRQETSLAKFQWWRRFMREDRTAFLILVVPQKSTTSTASTDRHLEQLWDGMIIGTVRIGFALRWTSEWLDNTNEVTARWWWPWFRLAYVCNWPQIVAPPFGCAGELFFGYIPHWSRIL